MDSKLVLAHQADTRVRVCLLGRKVDATHEFGRLLLEYGESQATLHLKDAIDVPDVALKEEEAGEYRLKRLAELGEDATVEILRALQSARETLKQALSRRHEVLVSRSAENQQKFFGVTAVLGAELQAEVSIAPEVIDDRIAEDTVLIRARASAAIGASTTWTADGQEHTLAAAGGVALEMMLRLTGATAALDIALPGQLPDFELPAISMPKLNFSGLIAKLGGGLPSFAGLASFPLLSDFGFRWEHEPEIQVDVSDTGEVSIQTSGPGLGHFGQAHYANPIVTVDDFRVQGKNKLEISAKATIAARTESIILPEIPAGPVRLLPGTAELKVGPFTIGGGQFDLPIVLKFERLVIASSNDPSLTLPLALKVKVTVKNGDVTTKLEQLEVLPPYGLNLLADLGAKLGELLGGTIRFAVPIPQIPSADFPELPLKALLDRIGAMLAAAARWLAEQAAAAGRVLSDIGEAFIELLKSLYRWLSDLKRPSFGNVLIEVRLDARDWSLRQVVIAPVGKDIDERTFLSALGVDLGLHLQARPSLVIDFKAQWMGIALQFVRGKKLAVIGTDLWIARNSAPAEPLTVLDPKTGNRQDSDFEKPKRLLGVEINALDKPEQEFVLAAVQRGNVRLFQTFGNNGKPPDLDFGGGVHASLTSESSDLHDADWPKLFELKPWVDKEAIKEGLLNLLPKADPEKKPAGNGLLDKLSQYVKVREVETSMSADGIKLDLGITVVIANQDIDTKLQVLVDPRTLTARIRGQDVISISKIGPQSFRLLGLDGRLWPKGYAEDDPKIEKREYKALQLDLRAGRQSFGLHEEAVAKLEYGAASTSGRGMVFQVDKFEVTSSGLDLSAKITPDPVVLGGIDMPFRFTSGGIQVKNSKFLGGSLAGSGQLPRALIGEANASIALSLTRGPDDEIVIESAEARLEKTGDPIVCESTRFRLTITELGMGFVREGAYHFYFQLTGNARFTPNKGESTEGLLKHLGNLEIQLKKTPLTSDPRVLLRSISFQVKCEPPKTGTFFDIFQFELRGFGLHPSSQAFSGDPAISVSGQVKFAFGDVVSSRIDCHQLYIAAPRPPSSFPRVRFDGLTVGLQLGGMASVEGTAVAVDGSLPELFKPGTLPSNVTANGFLAAGRIELKGWAPMSANMGFLELRKHGAAPRHAFYFYLQRNKMSVEIPTPVGSLYLREVGFGFGYRYTLAAIAQAEQAQSPRELIRILDEVSKYQGNLDQIRAWEPTYDNAGLTLAMRAMFTVASASTNDAYQPEAELELPNPLLFDVVAAIRSDLTFFMNVRAWLSVNYADWINAGEAAALKSNPTQSGYLYLSAPRQEFLGRFVSDGQGHVGEHPKLPDALKQAIANSRFSATLYIRPGLFHFELGWPYELSMHFGDPNGDFFIQCNGGMIHRIEDGAMLMGIAFRGVGHARFSGRVGGDSLGASASAFAQFALEAKALTYLSIRSPGDTMLYGSFQLDVSVGVAVSVWLRFKVWRYTVTLSAGFSLSLTLSVGVELVLLADKGIGGRAHVAIGVQAFGRSLSLGIGFAFGSGNLELARARVARFMALGLTTETPPAPGEAPAREQRSPALEASRGDRAAMADDRTDVEAKHPAELPKPPGARAEEATQEPRAVGQEMTHTDFWALIFPTSDPKNPGTRLYVLQFVPRDHTPVEGAAPDETAATFFASPEVLQHPEDQLQAIADGAPHILEFEAPPANGLWELTHLGEIKNVLQEQKTDMVLARRVIGPQDGTEGITFGELLTELFMKPGEKVTRMTEPAAQTTAVERARLGSDAQANAERLTRAGRHRRGLKAKEKQEAEIAERRSAVLGAVVETAQALAARGADSNGVWPPISPDQLECRDFGMTFIVTEATLKVLFPSEPENVGPPPGKLKIRKRDSETLGTVHLFNPPARHFRDSAPRLARPEIRQTASGLELDWDLEPAWGASEGAYADPEFHLSYYTISRRIVGLRFGDWQANFRAKGAAPIEVENEQRRFIRPSMQFVDDFSQPPNLPEDLRRLLSGQAVKDAAEVWLKYSDLPQLTVEYLVVPVDVAGTSDIGTPLQQMYEAPVPFLLTPTDPRLQVTYPATPVLGWSPGAQAQLDGDRIKPLLRMSLSLPEEPGIKAKEQGTGKKKGSTGAGATEVSYRLRIRRERAMPGGLFGDEVIETARRRPDQPDMDAKRADDVDFRLTIKKIAAPAPDDEIPLDLTLPKGILTDSEWSIAVATKDDKPAYDQLLGHLGLLDAESVPVRAFLCADSWSDDGPRAGAWSPVVFGLAIRGLAPKPRSKLKSEPSQETPDKVASEKLPPPMNATLDVFEAVRAVEFLALQRKDMHVETGRLHLAKPGPRSSLKDLLADQPGLRSAHDVKRRVATRLTWRARPRKLELSDGGPAPKDAWNLVGGFDLFAVDPDLLPPDFRPQQMNDDPDRFSQPMGRITMLPARMRGLTPDGFGDLGKIETAYPSEMARIDAATGHGHDAQPSKTQERPKSAAGKPRLAPWFSAAESVAVFARPMLRRSLCAAPDEALVAGLLSCGQPQAIRVRLEHWPATGGVHKVPAPKVTVLPDGLDASWYQCSPWQKEPSGTRFSCVEGQTFTAAHVRQLLQALCLGFENAGEEWIAAVKADPEVFSRVHVVVEAIVKPAPEIDEMVLHGERLSFNPLTRLHPVLADALDFLVYAHHDKPQPDQPHDPGKVYRRYEVVRDADPQTDAKSLAAFQDGLPAARDPYGWAGLRVLGLATGFRVYDTETGDFLRGTALLEQVQRALARARGRYADVREDLGSPFVDLVTSPWGNSRLFWFDGGQRDPTGEEQKNLIDQNTLASVQIALRPVPDRMHANLDFRRVRYHRLIVPADLATLEIQPRTGFDDPTWPAFFDVVEVAPFAQPHAVRIDKGLSAKVQLGKATRDRIFFVRSCILRPDEVPSVPFKLVPELSEEQEKTHVCEVEMPDAWPKVQRSGTEPFGLFKDLAPTDWRRVLLDDRLEPCKALARLSHYASRRFGTTEPIPNETEAIETARRAVEFWRCHLEHSAADLPGDNLSFSLGTLADPGSWRVPVDAEGMLSVVHVEAERFGGRRRYAVRPFGRFESLAAQTPTAFVKEKAYGYVAPKGLQRGLPTHADTKVHWKLWNDRFADGTLPRTEPVAKPVILSAVRVENRRALELVVAHTADQSLAHANRAMQARVAQHGIGVGFWREFAHRQWAASLDGALDLLAPFGGLDAEIDSELLDVTMDPAPGADFDKLRERVPDAWMGATVVRARSLPYFFRIHALVHATAGVMVSEPTGATFAEGFSRLQLPWSKDHHQAQVIGPRYSVSRHGGGLTIGFTIPAVRFIDCMEAEDVELWQAGSEKQWPAAFAPVVHLPEPSTGYRIAIATGQPGATSAWQPELELLAAPDGKTAAVYALQEPGTRFTSVQDTQDMRTITPQPQPDRKGWTMLVDAKPRAGTEKWEPPPGDALPPNAATCLEFLKLEPGDAIDAWKRVAPVRTLRIEVSRPTLVAGIRDWKSLADACDATAAELAKWKNAGVQAMLDAATFVEAIRVISRIDGGQDAAWSAQFGDGETAHQEIAKWISGLPASVISGPFTTTVKDFIVPKDLGLPAQQRGEVMALLTKIADECLGDLASAFHKAMREHFVKKQLHLEVSVGGVVPLVKALSKSKDDDDFRDDIRRYATDHPAVFGLLYSSVTVSLRDGQPSLIELDKLLERLERMGAAGAANLIVDWAVKPTNIAVPVSLPFDPVTLQPELTAINASLSEDAEGAAVAALVLWKPPEDAELAPAEGVKETSIARLRELAQEQLFGLGRRPLLIVTRGAETPIDSEFQRTYGA